MRIGLVIESFDPSRGGAEQWTCQLADALVARGHEVHVAAQSFAALPQPPIVAHAAPRHCSRLAFAAAAERLLRPLGLDIVHDMGAGWFGQVFSSHDGSRLALWEHKLAALPAWVRPAKRLMTHVLPRYREFRRLLARQFADPRRTIIAMSQMVADDYCRWHGVRPEQIRLVYHGIDAERFSPARTEPLRPDMRRQLGLGDEETAFLFVGHDFARKGLSTAIRALARFVAQGRPGRLLVVGRDRRQAAYARLAQRCGVGHCVRFLAAQSDPLPYYAAADVAVLPTFYDPFGLVVLEAAGCGLPVISSRFAGASELIRSGVEGFVLNDPTDDGALAEQMLALSMPDRRLLAGHAARLLARRHTFDRNCDETVAVYLERLDRRAAA
jgi:UDP-glucose:(heptosyl)LPS alpha-1,3-glucosyltransferase